MADTTPSLSGYTWLNNRSIGGITDPNDPQVQAALAQVQKYDPTASLRPSYGSDGQLLGYTLDADASKLPGVNGSGSLGGASGHGSGADFMPTFSTVQDHMQLNDPNAVTQSGPYGKITANSNIGGNRSWLDTVGPLAVLAFGGALGGFGAFGGGGAGSGASALDTSGDSYLGLTNDGFPAFQGVPSGGGALLDQPLGSAESSLYGDSALTNPTTALNGGGATTGGLTDAQWNDIIAQQPENGSFVGPNGTDPNGLTPADYTELNNFNAGLDNPLSLSNLSSKIPSLLTKLPGLLKPLGGGGGNGNGGGGGGGGLLNLTNPAAQSPYASLTETLRKYYGGGLLGK